MATSITLQIDGVYPDIVSGVISFQNGRTGTKVALRAPADLISGAYVIRSVTMDSGAGVTVLPTRFAERLDVERPLPKAEEYYIFGGVGGASVCFPSPDPLVIGIDDGKGRLARAIKPFS